MTFITMATTRARTHVLRARLATMTEPKPNQNLMKHSHARIFRHLCHGPAFQNGNGVSVCSSTMSSRRALTRRRYDPISFRPPKRSKVEPHPSLTSKIVRSLRPALHTSIRLMQSMWSTPTHRHEPSNSPNISCTVTLTLTHTEN